MGKREEKLEELGFPLSDTPKAAGIYTPLVVDGTIAYASGMLPVENGALKYAGKVSSQVGVEEATKAARLCAANLLRVCARDLGSLDRIAKILKLTGFVNSDPDFAEQHVVMNGASSLFIDVLGEAGRHARSAIGMAGLPLDGAVEVEIVIRLTD
ncbi:MAG: RidA family protein [Spirochaetales bacterium]|nr:RidA family protein [Spirochaetales bacterium]